MKKHFSKFLASISIAASSIAGPSNSAEAVVTPPLTKCHIEVGDPHISKYLLRKRGIRAVKVNSSSRCDKPMTELTITVAIYKDLFIGRVLIKTSTKSLRGYIPANKVIKNEKTYFECKNMDTTKYFGVANASAVVDGESLKTLDVRSEKTPLISCGS